MLIVKKLVPHAKEPTIAYENDLGWDLYATDKVILYKGAVTQVRTGIACAAVKDEDLPQGMAYVSIEFMGLIIKDRSSLAFQGIVTHGGVIDPGYRGEIVVLMSNMNSVPWFIEPGDKIAQMIPIRVRTGRVVVQSELPMSERGVKAFGSSGR